MKRGGRYHEWMSEKFLLSLALDMSRRNGKAERAIYDAIRKMKSEQRCLLRRHSGNIGKHSVEYFGLIGVFFPWIPRLMKNYVLTKPSLKLRSS